MTFLVGIQTLVGILQPPTVRVLLQIFIDAFLSLAERFLCLGVRCVACARGN